MTLHGTTPSQSGILSCIVRPQRVSSMGDQTGANILVWTWTRFPTPPVSRHDRRGSEALDGAKLLRLQSKQTVIRMF